MRLTTNIAEFKNLAAAQNVVAVCRELFSDADTPVSIYRKLTAAKPGSFLLESAAHGIFDRYSFVGVNNFGQLLTENGKPVWQSGQTPGLSLEELLPGGIANLQPFAAFEQVYRRWISPAPADLPPLVSGFVGYLGWDTISEFESAVADFDSTADVPTQYLCFVSDMVVIDHHQGRVILVANCLTKSVTDSNDLQLAQLWDAAQARLDAMQQNLAAPTATTVATINPEAIADPLRHTAQADYFNAVAKIKQHIVDGDVFQAVLAQRFDLKTEADPLDIYRVLRHLNPSPYLYLLQCQTAEGANFSVVGSSPEALITVQKRQVVTHPIAGSRPRGATRAADEIFATELAADVKEKSEHVMLVDLARNDLSRVCEPASIAVPEFLQLEKFSHIMHLTSTVTGVLRQECDALDALRATFPAGTLSGAPKPWALKIISELETQSRGVYGGVVGYFGLGGDADLAIAIRTATVKDGVARVHAGAGIVADSQPLAEDTECVNKAAAPLKAVIIAETLRS